MKQRIYSKSEEVNEAMRHRLLDTDNGVAKRYLRQLISEIRFDGQRVVMRGKKAAIMAAAAQKKWEL